jgi:hypothetical protein
MIPTPRRRSVATKSPDKGWWATVIVEVKSIPGLSALAILVLGETITAFVIRANDSESLKILIWSFVGFLVFTIAVNLIYFLRVELDEISFRVRVNRSCRGKDEPWPDLTVKLFRSNSLEQERHTNEDGEVMFRVKVGRKDELYVEVLDPKTNERKRAAVFSDGQCRMVKMIRVEES